MRVYILNKKTDKKMSVFYMSAIIQALESSHSEKSLNVVRRGIEPRLPG